MKLEIGGGEFPAFPHSPDWQQCDIRSYPHIDHVCDARKLPFHNNTYEEVYSSQTLEHFGWRETEDVLREWYRVLMPGGKITISVPDILGIYEDYLSGKNTFELFVERIYGSADYPQNKHQTGFSHVTIQPLFERVGFKNIQVVRTHQGGGILIEGWK